MAIESDAVETVNILSHDTMERHRCIVSLQEELEAIDHYDQRIDATTDVALRKVLTENRDDEKEHFAKLLEWLRQRDSVLDDQIEKFETPGGRDRSNDTQQVPKEVPVPNGDRPDTDRTKAFFQL